MSGIVNKVGSNSGIIGTTEAAGIDYEEGTFTPNITANSGSTSAATYSTRNGTYRKIGKMVFVRFEMQPTHISNMSGNIRFSSMPFARDSGSGFDIGGDWLAVFTKQDFAAGARLEMNPGEDWMDVIDNNFETGVHSGLASDVDFDTGTLFRCSFQYMSA